MSSWIKASKGRASSSSTDTRGDSTSGVLTLFFLGDLLQNDKRDASTFATGAAESSDDTEEATEATEMGDGDLSMTGNPSSESGKGLITLISGSSENLTRFPTSSVDSDAVLSLEGSQDGLMTRDVRAFAALLRATALVTDMAC